MTTLALRGHGHAGQRLQHLLAVLREIAFGRYDAIFAYHAAAAILGCGLGRIAGMPLRVAHQTAMPHAIRPLWRWLDRLWGRAGLYTHIVANSSATAQAFADLSRPPIAAACYLFPMASSPCRPCQADATGAPPSRSRSRAPLLLATGRLTAAKKPRHRHRRSGPSARCPSGHRRRRPRSSHAVATGAGLGVAGRLHLVGGHRSRPPGRADGGRRSLSFPLRLGDLRPGRRRSRHVWPAHRRRRSAGAARSSRARPGSRHGPFPSRRRRAKRSPAAVTAMLTEPAIPRAPRRIRPVPSSPITASAR